MTDRCAHNESYTYFQHEGEMTRLDLAHRRAEIILGTALTLSILLNAYLVIFR